MSTDTAVEGTLDERDPRSALLVLGMHRSGTSAVTGALRLCGAWLGEETELTEANAENPHGFWERRDIRQICDRLLHAAGADWWKVASFDPDAIPHAILVEQRRKFGKIISVLDEHETWVVKEPRLCLLLSVLRDHITNPVCIHIFRNPLEVARSLQTRNGFSIAAGLALWEAYNRHALSASENLPRALVFHEALMLHPMETLEGLLKRLDELAVTNLERPDEGRLKRFISPSLYRRRATAEETEEYLSPSQRVLWQHFCDEQISDHDGRTLISRATRQCLFDLGSAEQSLNHHKDRRNELAAEVGKRAATIEARDETIRGLKSRTEELHAELVKRAATIEARDETNRGLKSRTEELHAELVHRTATTKARDETIRGLLASNSWRITAPMRSLSRGVRWLLKNSRRAPKLLFWLSTGQFSRAINAMRFVLEKSNEKNHTRQETNEQRTSADTVSKIIRHYGKNSNRPTQAIVQEKFSANRLQTKVSVIAWDLGHNPLGRAYLLADVLRAHYDVELIGANFPRFGNEIWEPLRIGSRVTIKNFPGGNFPEHFKRMEDIAEQIEGDIIYVSKPRLPGLELAILAKMRRNRPIILDIDDYELGFFENRRPLTLETVKTNSRKLDFNCPHDEIWTRYSESLIPLFEQITVSNEELQKKYGGMVLPHIRSEVDFEPNSYPRDAIREELGFSPEDKVILFAGTPRMHKGFARVATALKKLNRTDSKLLIVGSSADSESRRYINNIDPEYVKVIRNVPFCDLPSYLCVGDLICLLQDKRKVTSHFQMPAKFTDGLSMGIPMLATNVPPLVNLANGGLVELLDDTPLEKKIDTIFSNYEVYKNMAMKNRKIFLAEYSYDANLPKLKNMIDSLLHSPVPIPDAFHELVAYHREIFSSAADLPRVTAKVVTAGVSGCQHAKSDMTTPVGPPVVSALKNRSYVDDKMDIVFFWKQNDTGIYGRRQDMLVKYLAKDSRIHRIYHFDAPINLFQSSRAAVKSGEGGRYSHARLVLYRTLGRKMYRKNQEKIRFDTFIFGTRRRVPAFMRWIFPSEKDYLDYLDRIFVRHKIGQRRTIFWVCPNNFHFPSIERQFQPDLVVADVIDDQRKWAISPKYEEKLYKNYKEILGRSHLVFTNCHNVFESMQEFTANIHVLPNAAELLEQEIVCQWKKPVELRRLEGPVIGYVGNLDIARIDLDLLAAVATERPDWNLVFIGPTHMGKEVRKLDKFRNVHFLGVRVYDQAIRYIRHFDVAMIPHLDNKLTRNMNPLKLYVYYSLHVPVVTTPIANIEDFRKFMQIGHTPNEFIERIDYCLDNNPLSENPEDLEDLLKANSWDERVTRILELIDGEFAGGGMRQTSTIVPNEHISA